MRRHAAAAAAVAALLTFAACGTAQSATPHAAAPETLRLYERDTQQASVDLGDRGTSPGDLFVFSGDLFDGGPGGPKTGRADGSCTTAAADAHNPGTLVCSIALVLGQGQVETQTVVESGPLFTGTAVPIAIVGGTGAYNGAHGDGTATVPDVNDPSAVRFDLTVRP